MANWSQALLNLGEGLGMLAGHVATRERDEIMAMREENLARLRARLHEESAQREREFIKERDETQFQRDLIGIGTRASLDMQAGDRAHAQRRELIEMEQDRIDARETARGNTPFARVASAYQDRIDKIDARIQDITDQRIKAASDAAANLGELDPKLVEPWDRELRQLQAQRTALQAAMDEELAGLGAPGYRRLSDEEVEKLRAPRERPAPAQQPRSAQAPIDDVPPPPPKPAGMAEREERKSRKVAPAEPRKPVSRDNISGEAFKGARQARDLLSRVGSALSARKSESDVVRAAKSGKKLSADEKQALRNIGRERLKGVYGFTDDQLDRLL